MAVTTTGTTRMQSFPFDSKPDGYDADGYPVYDRAVGASLLRETFAKFFSNGVFPSPGTALNIGKADSGLAVTIQPGIAIINGAMGGIEGDDPITLTLDTAPPQGNVCYAVMLRYDNTDEFRSLYFRTVRGEPSSSPQPPTPETSSPEVYEIRLGYVTIPSGATDLSSATVVNEKGLSTCPYAAPFEEIDVSGVIEDTKQAALDALSSLDDYIQTNMEFIDSAIDGTVAGNLQAQINELSAELGNFDISDSVDNVTIEYTQEFGDSSKKLRVKNGSIGIEQITPTFLADLPYIGTGQKAKKAWSTGSVDACLTSDDEYGINGAAIQKPIIGSNVVFDGNGTAFAAAIVQSDNDYKKFKLLTVSMTKDGVVSHHSYQMPSASHANKSLTSSAAATLVAGESGCTAMCVYPYHQNNKSFSFFAASIDASGNVVDTASSVNSATSIAFNPMHEIVSESLSNGAKETFVAGFNQGSDKSTYDTKMLFFRLTPEMAISSSEKKADYGFAGNLSNDKCPYRNGTDKVVVPYACNQTTSISTRHMIVNMLNQNVENSNFSIDTSLSPGTINSLSITSTGAVQNKKRNQDYSVATETIISEPSMTFSTNSMKSVQFSGSYSGFYYDPDSESVFVPGTKAGYTVNGGVANYAKNTTELPSSLIGPNSWLDKTFFENENSSMRRYNIQAQFIDMTTGIKVFTMSFGSEVDE